MFQKRKEQYLPSLFVIEEGKAAFHERLHYWQHLGSTFGAFQIIGFHITAKAMRITIRELITARLMEVPIRQHTLQQLYERTKRSEVQQAWNYLKLLKVFESARFTKPIPLTELSPGNRFFGGSHGRQPLFKISKTLGVPFTAYHVKENHAIAIAKLRCEQESVGAVEAELWNRAEKWLGEEAAKWVALLCDWALMSPNPNMINQKPGEIHPGSRFLQGLEALSKVDTKTRKTLQGLNSLSSWLSKVLGWQSIDTSLKHYESFIHLARKGTKNKNDAIRNRRTYNAFVGMLEAARDLRFGYPEALAFPHLYESMLNEALPVIAVKRGRKLEISSTKHFCKDETSSWYPAYLANASLVLQAFGYKEKNRDRIECVHRHLGIEEDCSTLMKAGERKACYAYPCPCEEPIIECGFLDLCRKLGLN